MRLAISTTETLTDLKTDLIVANNNGNNNKSVVKLFKVPVVEVVAARLSNESALLRMTASTPKTLVDLTLVLDE